MSIQITARVDTSKIPAIAKGKLAKQMPFATSLALNNVAFDVRRETQQQLPSWINITKTKFFTSSVVVEKATRTNLTATVGFLDRVKLIKFMEDTGVRQPERSVIAVPYGLKGRGKKGQITKAQRPKALIASGKVFQKTVGGVPGIWQYVNRKLTLLWAYEKQTSYKTKFTRFRDTAYDIFQKNINKRMEEALRKAIATAK